MTRVCTVSTVQYCTVRRLHENCNRPVSLGLRTPGKDPYLNNSSQLVNTFIIFLSPPWSGISLLLLYILRQKLSSVS